MVTVCNAPSKARLATARSWAGISLMCCHVALLLVLTAPARLRAEEPTEAFLEALRARGYFDTALLYLDRMDNNPLVSHEFQSELAYQRGVTMVQAATFLRDRSARERMLTEAKASLEKFLREEPGSPKRLFARRQFILLLRQWANMKVESAKRTSTPALLKEAGQLYDEAYQASLSAVAELKEALSKLKTEIGPNAAQEKIDLRDSLRGEYLLTLLRAAESLEEKADTEPAKSPTRKALLDQAGKRYADMYKKYGEKLAGARARFYQARCLVKQGDCKTALSYLQDDLLGQTNNQHAARQLKTQALLLAIDCWLGESTRDYAAAISRGTQWLETMRPAESKEDDWVQLRLALARANKRYADQLAKENPRDNLVKSSREAARRLARAVSRLPGPYQEDGRMLLAEIPGGVSAARNAPREKAKTFEQARSRGTEAIAEMQSAQYFLANVPERLQKEKKEEIREELRKKLKEAEENVTRRRREATDNLLLALTYADKSTPLEDLNLVRRLLAYLYYVDGQYYDAAVMGEFIGRRFPGTNGARMGAQIALAAYLKLYETNPNDEKPFETEHVMALANYIVDTWAGTPEAGEAINTLIPFLIRQGKLDTARAYVESIPPDSPERGAAELRIGEALWRDYLIGMQQLRTWEKTAKEGGAEAVELNAKIAARRPELETLQTTAMRTLEAGIQRMKDAGTINATMPRAVLSLSQIYTASGKAAQALALLDDPKIGVLPMIQRNDAAIESPTLREQAYRVALNAMVSALPKLQNTQQRTALIERIREMMNALRAQIGDSPKSQKRLVDIFYTLALGLETQLQLLDKPEDRKILSEGFRAFLEQVRDEAKDLRILNWVAQSYASLGNGLAQDAKSADAACACFAAAAATYDQILDNARQHELTPEKERMFRFRKAVALRDAGKFAEAIEMMKQLLEQDNRKLEFQQEAARTYQLWAADPKEGIRYLTAVRGTAVDPKTKAQTAWGWSRIAKVTQRTKQYRNDFYEARYNTALCDYQLALRLRKESDRKKYLTRAQNELVFTHRLYPSLGGPEWFGKYNTLLKKIQQALGQRAKGLPRKGK